MKAGLIFLLFALLGAPLFIIFGSVSIYNYAQEGITSEILSSFYSILTKPPLVAIPLFTFAGYVLAESNAPKRLVNVAQAFVGWLPGGLAIVCIMTCAFFTAFTGASGVTIVALGGLLYPVLIKEGYNEKFALGLVTSCGSIGLLFAPSLPVILYGVIDEISIDKLFLAGILPSLLLILALGAYSMYIARRDKVALVPFEGKNILKSIKGAAWELPLPFLLIWGIYGGFFAPSEAAAMTALYVLIVEVFLYRDLNIFKDIPRIIRESMVLVGGILLILGTSKAMTDYMVITAQTPQKLLAWAEQFIDSQFMFLIILNLLLLVVGCLMDIFSAIIVVVPLISPIAHAFDINPFHLALIFLVNLEIGYLTPPVGLNLFISSFRFKKGIIELYRVSVPFLILMLLCLILITYIPGISLMLVDLFSK